MVEQPSAVFVIIAALRAVPGPPSAKSTPYYLSHFLSYPTSEGGSGSWGSLDLRIRRHPSEICSQVGSVAKTRAGNHGRAHLQSVKLGYHEATAHESRLSEGRLVRPPQVLPESKRRLAARSGRVTVRLAVYEVPQLIRDPTFYLQVFHVLPANKRKSGEGGIRTHETVRHRLRDFQSQSFRSSPFYPVR